jgi:histidine phosphotransferase ChpT
MSLDDLSPTLSAPVSQDTPPAQPEIGAISETETQETAAGASLPGRHELATQMVAKLCHDFISPAGAIICGLDLLEDPSAQDMKQEALNLISASAKKMVALVHFARVAFGASNTAESFSGAQLQKILNDTFSTMRAELDYRIDGARLFEKPAARALLNLGLIMGNALPMGGKALLEARDIDGKLILTGESRGPRARLKPEAIEGLTGLSLGDGLAGQWIQPHWLHSVVSEAGGDLKIDSDTDLLTITITLPGAA